MRGGRWRRAWRPAGGRWCWSQRRSRCRTRPGPSSTRSVTARPDSWGGPARTLPDWLGIRAGRFEAVVATRPGVFAPLPDLGLVWISREVHPGHREDRAPYYHVRDVAMARAAIHRAACVLASLSPSVATASAASSGAVRTARAARGSERAAAPLVETTPSEAEDRSARLGRLLKEAARRP